MAFLAKHIVMHIKKHHNTLCPSYTSSEVRKLVGFSQMLCCRGSMDQLMDNDVQKLGRGSGFLPATKKTEQLSHKRKVIYLHISLIKFYAVHKGGRQYNSGRSPGTLQKKWTTNPVANTIYMGGS